MQQEIIELLEKHRKPLTLTEITISLNPNPNNTFKINVSRALKKLLYYNEIKCIEVDRILALRLTDSKKPRRMKLYFVK